MLILRLLRCGSLGRFIRSPLLRRNSLCFLRLMTLRSPQCILCSHYSTISTKPTASCETIMAASGTWRQTMGGYRAQIVGKQALNMSFCRCYAADAVLPSCYVLILFRTVTHMFLF